MNLIQLVYLKELLHYGSYTKAAQNLGVTQPALSAQIKKLEEETSLSLIDRTARPLKLTGDGEYFFEEALEILQRLDKLRDLSDHLSHEIKGELRMGIIPTLAPYFIPFFIDDLQHEYPELELSIEELITEDIIHKIRTGNLDAGLISTPVNAGRMKFRTLFYERFFLYVSDDHPLYDRDEVSLDDFDPDEIWYLKEGNCFRNQVNSLCNLSGRRRRKPVLVYKTNSVESLRRIVESRKGITFIPELATVNLPSEYEDMIKPIKGDDHVREISLVYSSLYVKKRLIDSFAELAVSRLPKHMRSEPRGEGTVLKSDIKLKY